MSMKRILSLPLILLCSLLGMAQNRVAVTPATPLDNAEQGTEKNERKG